MLASFLKRDLRNLFRKDASPNFQAQNGLLSLRSRWRSVRSLRISTGSPGWGRPTADSQASWPANHGRGWPRGWSPRTPDAEECPRRSAPRREPQAGSRPPVTEKRARGNKRATWARRWADRRFWGAARSSREARAWPGSRGRGDRAWARSPTRRAGLASTNRAA